MQQRGLLVAAIWFDFFFYNLRRRNTTPTTSSMKSFGRNNCFWFSSWFGLRVGCGLCTS
jgi:hypothetical protein